MTNVTISMRDKELDRFTTEGGLSQSARACHEFFSIWHSSPGLCNLFLHAVVMIIYECKESPVRMTRQKIHVNRNEIIRGSIH